MSSEVGLRPGTRAHAVAGVFRALIIGPPGGGKGTISERLARDFKLSVLGSGDMIRSQIRSKTAVCELIFSLWLLMWKVGLQVEALVNSGQLVPDNVWCSISVPDGSQIMMQLVFGEISGYAGKPLLLDGMRSSDCTHFLGFPRTVVQAQNLEQKFPIDFVLNIDVPFETIVERLKVWHPLYTSPQPAGPALPSPKRAYLQHSLQSPQSPCKDLR
jgi:adenylate kinase family enzyme